MPSPLFVLCAHDVIIDAEHKLVSVVKIVERVELEKRRIPQDGKRNEFTLPLPPLNIVKALAVWRKEDGDDQQEFDFEMAVVADDKELAKSSGTFRFEAGKWLHRFILAFPIALPIESDCTLRIDSRVRKTGDESWITQSYPMACHVTMIDTASTTTSG